MQRFKHFVNAFKQLKNVKKLKLDRDFTELKLQGFEVSQELSWKVLKDFLDEPGKTDLFGSKIAIKEAFNVELITSGEIWLEMIRSRNLTSYIYDNSEIITTLNVI